MSISPDRILRSTFEEQHYVSTAQKPFTESSEHIPIDRIDLDDWIEQVALPDQRIDRVTSFTMAHGDVVFDGRRIELQSKPLDVRRTFIGGVVYPATPKNIRWEHRRTDDSILINAWVTIALTRNAQFMIKTRTGFFETFNPDEDFVYQTDYHPLVRRS